MRVYGYIKVDTEGYGDGTEARVMVYENQEDAVEAAWNSYQRQLNYILDNNEMENEPEDEEEFKSRFINELAAGLIQCHDYHIQYEYFEKEVH